MKGKVIDIDNAFLNGDLEHEIYMKIPEGYDEVISKDVNRVDSLILQKAVYGLGSSSKTILEDNCGQDAGRRF